MRSNYLEILSHKVEIPIIQRDYAQGRTDSKTNKIRKDFLDVLFDFIQSKCNNPEAEIELDFIYGFNERDEKQALSFVPIDGQQRLTTLWLLYWFVTAKENVCENEKIFLSNFVYETRHSTTQFCKELIRFSPNFKNVAISSEIINQPWYFETWDYDPSIQAMLVVLDDIEKRYSKLGRNNLWQFISQDSCPFYFYKLDMKKVGLTDDLYIKMNSRGKPLTEFEYFKAGFLELISNSGEKNRFEQSVDGIWIDTVWHIVNGADTIDDEEDIALLVDNAFLNLFNFTTSIIAFRKDIKADDGKRYINTVESAELLREIYRDSDNVIFLFDTLDAICDQQYENNSFWEDTFYSGKGEFNTQNTRLFFQYNELNLLKRCLFSFGEQRSLSYPEQLILLACFTHFKNPHEKFKDRIRTVRNLVANSENELRESTLGKSLDEVENYILTGDLNLFNNFKTDQIEEEKQKALFTKKFAKNKELLHRIEDSDLLRGSISLLPLDLYFNDNAQMFFILFDEDELVINFNQKLNLLLCFGDYSQDDRSLTNLIAGSKASARYFLTTPGYNKTQFQSKTRSVMLDCLKFFIENKNVTANEKIRETITDYDVKAKDWRYYFIRYQSFRQDCHYGFYHWRDEHYLIWKMGRKQFNGYHWDPFLHEVFLSSNSPNLILENYGHNLLVNTETDKISISTVSNGFNFEDAFGKIKNGIINGLINSGKLNAEGILEIHQNSDLIDIEDRLEKLKGVIACII